MNLADAEHVVAAVQAELGKETRVELAKTGKAMVIQDSVVPYSFGAEVSAQINQELWGALKAPVVRVGAAFTPKPFSPELSKGHYPQLDAIIDQAKRLVG